MGNWKKVDKFVVIEYFFIGYIIITSLLNVLNIFGILDFTRGFMKATFWGPSMLICLIIQYGLGNTNRNQAFGDKIRPIITGVIVANIFSTCRMPYCLFLLLIIGYYMQISSRRHCNIQKSMLVVLYSGIGIEIYSVLFLLQKEKTGGVIGEVMSSYYLDMFFMFVVVVYGIIIYINERYKDRQEKAFEIFDIEEENIEGHALSQKGNKCFRIWNLILGVYDKVYLNSEKIIYLVGVIFCVCAIGLFGLYSVTISTGEERIRNSEEEVFLLQHNEDTSQVLTLVEENGSYKIAFDKYIGTNNQKIQILDMGDGTFQFIFLEPRMAIEMAISEENGTNFLIPSQVSDIMEQRWNKEILLGLDGFDMVTRITKDNDVPIYYQTLEQGKGISQVGVGKESGGNEYFPIERTISNDFITKTIVLHKEDFQPTAMISINIERFSGGSYLLFLFISLVFCSIIYARRIVGDKCGLLNAVMFLFLLAYGAISVIALFLVTFGLQCYIGVLVRRKRVLEKTEHV